MLIGKEFDAFFVKTITSLRDYAQDFVCVGGCANALYRHHAFSSPASLAFAGTHDIDLIVANKVPVRKGRTIAEVMADAGMEERHYGTSKQAVVKYVPKDAQIAVDLEFLCSATGLPGVRRGKSIPVSYEVQTDLMAQPLRYLELLHHRPWSIDAGDVAGMKALAGIQIRIPNPAAYIMQKILIQDEGRKRRDIAKDCYYVFEVSVVFRQAMPVIRKEFESIRNSFPDKWVKRFQTGIAALFRDEYAEGAAMAARMCEDIKTGSKKDSPVDEAVISASVRRMIASVFTP